MHEGFTANIPQLIPINSPSLLRVWIFVTGLLESRAVMDDLLFACVELVFMLPSMLVINDVLIFCLGRLFFFRGQLFPFLLGITVIVTIVG